MIRTCGACGCEFETRFSRNRFCLDDDCQSRKRAIICREMLDKRQADAERHALALKKRREIYRRNRSVSLGVPRGPQVGGVVYALCDEHGCIRYVGATTQVLSARLWQHCYSAKHDRGRSHVRAWIRSMSVKPTIRELERVESGLGAAEQRWIARLRADGVKLTNATSGGDGIGLRPCRI